MATSSLYPMTMLHPINWACWRISWRRSVQALWEIYSSIIYHIRQCWWGWSENLHILQATKGILSLSLYHRTFESLLDSLPCHEPAVINYHFYRYYNFEPCCCSMGDVYVMFHCCCYHLSMQQSQEDRSRPSCDCSHALYLATALGQLLDKIFQITKWCATGAIARSYCYSAICTRRVRNRGERRATGRHFGGEETEIGKDKWCVH